MEQNTDLHSKIENKLEIEYLVKFIEDPISKQIVFDYFFWNFTKEEIAEKLKLSVYWVDVKMASAIDDMRLALL